jgi:sec-independent protein translocase protein TatA
MPFGLGGMELLIVLLVVVLLFGSAKLPKLARSIGEARREFQNGEAEAEAPQP